MPAGKGHAILKAMDPNFSYPVNITVERPTKPSRGWALAFLLFAVPKGLALVPHFIVLGALGFLSFFAAIAAQVAVLFTGRYPEPLFDFVVGVMRWQVRANAFFIGLPDISPPFRLDK